MSHDIGFIRFLAMANSDDHDDYSLEPAEVAVPPREKPMAFLDHLEELRWTLVKSAIAFVGCAVVIGVFLQKFNSVLTWPLNSAWLVMVSLLLVPTSKVAVGSW